MPRAEANEVVGARDLQNFGRADRLGEFERRLVGAAAQAAHGERLGHALVKFDDGRVRRRLFFPAREAEKTLAAQPQEPGGGEEQCAGREHEGRGDHAEHARDAPAALLYSPAWKPLTTRAGMRSVRSMTAIAVAKYSQWPARTLKRKSARGSGPEARIR